MLKVRPHQLETLSGDEVEAFVQHMVNRLDRFYEQEVANLFLDSAGLEWFVREGIRKAEQYRVVELKDVEVFIEAMTVLHPEFDTHPSFQWAGRILKQHNLTSSEKMDRINSALVLKDSESFS